MRRQLLPLILTDISFLHERSRLFGYYWATQNIFSSCLGLASSYQAVVSWRIYYWVYVAAVGLGFILVVFGAFETRFARPVTSLDGQVVVTDVYGVTHILSDEEAQSRLQEVQVATSSTTVPTKNTYRQMLKPWSGATPNASRIIFMSWVHMAESFTSPGILFAVLISSITLGCSIGVSLTYNTVLVENYHCSCADVSLINIGGIIGGLLGMAYAGAAGDKFVIWMAKRNHGVHKPEHRLIMLIFPAILGVASLLLYGFTAGGGATWWGPFMGWTLFQVVFVTVLIISTTFAAEAWPKNPGPAIVVVVGTKNLISFGATYGLTPMVQEHGYKWALGVLAGIFGAIFLLGVPIYFLNPRWRAYVARKEAKETSALSE